MGRGALLCFAPPDLMSWMEPFSLLTSLPTEGGISSRILEWTAGTADTSLLWNNDPHHQAAGWCRFTLTELVSELQPGPG